VLGDAKLALEALIAEIGGKKRTGRRRRRGGGGGAAGMARGMGARADLVGGADQSISHCART